MAADRGRIRTFLIRLGARELRHTGRTSLDHLEGTARILEEAGAPEAVILGGLLHNIYGTWQFQRSLVPIGCREVVASLVGNDVERIVFDYYRTDVDALFSDLDRSGNRSLEDALAPGLNGASVLDGAGEPLDLAAISIANYVEQRDHARSRKWVRALAAAEPGGHVGQLCALEIGRSQR